MRCESVGEGVRGLKYLQCSVGSGNNEMNHCCLNFPKVHTFGHSGGETTGSDLWDSDKRGRCTFSPEISSPKYSTRSFSQCEKDRSTSLPLPRSLHRQGKCRIEFWSKTIWLKARREEEQGKSPPEGRKGMFSKSRCSRSTLKSFLSSSATRKRRQRERTSSVIQNEPPKPR